MASLPLNKLIVNPRRSVEHLGSREYSTRVLGYKDVENWYSLNSIRHESTDYSAKLIPFSFVIKLPPPRYERMIVSRNQKGRIVHSVAPKIAL
jgi:hypothetical protein